MKAMYILALLGLFLLFGCLDPYPDNLYSYKDVTVPRDSIPVECYDMEDCEMFSCMVSQCWCKDSLTNGILSQSNAQVQSEEDAEAVVANYLTSNSIAYESGTVHAVNLNVIFYNVFYTNQSGNENMLTVAVDGTIMETECGV